MTTAQKLSSSVRRYAQQGISTVLMMLLIGTTMSTVVLGSMYYVARTQEQGISVHAQTQAQIKAWTGAQIVQEYLQQLMNNDASSSTTTLKTLASAVSSAGSSGINLSINGISGITATAVSVDSASAPTQITVNITGTSGGSLKTANSTIQVVYSLATSSSSSSASTTGQSCGTSPTASAVFRGNLSITGGTTSISANTDYAAIAVEGTLTVGSASQAKISGCVTSDISLSGGGIYDNAYLYSGGTITINSMATPVNATLWGKAVSIGNSGSGSYNAIKAGAYAASVITNGSTVGTTNVGGYLIPSTAGTTIPWTTGTVVPWDTGNIIVTLTDGTQYVVDMGSVTVDTSSGLISGAQAASTLLSGSSTMPDSFTLQSTSIYGGGIDLYTLKIGKLWGNALNIQGYSGTYSDIEAAGNVKAVTGTISSMKGGGYLWATAAGCSSSTNCWNAPAVSSGNIAGKLYYGSSQTLTTGIPGVNLSTSQTSTSPGLPGVPYCNTQVNTLDVNDYSAQANYIFGFDSNNQPMLVIQNVKTAGGLSLDGTYNLKTGDVRKLAGLPFMVCNWQTDPTNSGANCLQSTTTTSGWNLSGVTYFPPGITLFKGDLKIDGVSSTQATLNNTFMSTGSITLTSSGHVPIYAPNRASVSTVCDGNFYPTNLCNKTTSPSTLATWVDSDGVTHSGLPLANIGIATNKNFTVSGWVIYGNVIIGKQVDTAGASTNIYGTVTVGVNRSSLADTSTSTTITAGGLVVNTAGLTSDQTYNPGNGCGSGSTSTPATPGTATILWSRYL